MKRKLNQAPARHVSGLIVAAAIAAVLAGCGGIAHAYPDKPVRLIEPFGIGGGPDLLARALSPKLSELWGEPVTVENHPGAGSTVAPALVASPQPTVTRCS